MKKIYKIYLVFLFIITLNIQTVFAAPADTGLPTIANPFDHLNVQLPGLENYTKSQDILNSCTKNEKGELTGCKFPWLGEYIAWLYRYSLGIAGILATIIMMWGGMRWIMGAGDSSAIGDAKQWIGGAVTGLIILFTSYIILYQVNPDLTIMRPLAIGMVVEDEGIDTGAIGFSATPDAYDSHGSIIANAAYLLSKSTYYVEPNPKKPSPHRNDRGKLLDRTYYLDCSAFTEKVWVDAGLKSPGNTSAAQYSNAKEYLSTSNIKSLQAGDIIVYNGHTQICADNGCANRYNMGGPDGASVQLKPMTSSYLNDLIGKQSKIIRQSSWPKS